MGKVRVGLCVAATALVLAACTAGVDGTPVPAGEAPLTAAALGDLTSVDPCSLTGPAAFADVGSARMPGMPTFDDCRVTVAAPDGHAYVWVGLLRDATTLRDDLEPRDRPGRGTTIGSLGGTCDAALVLTDGLALTAWAEPAYGSPLDDTTLCALTEGALRGAYQVLDGGRVEHWVPPVSSLAVLDACDVVMIRHVQAALDLDAVDETPFPAGHRCRWGAPDRDSPGVDVEFRVAESAEDVGVPAGTDAELVGGRATWLVEHTDRTCTAVTEHVQFAPGAGTHEYALLRVVTAPRRGRDGCAAAKQLAERVWPELPPL
ncbi:hypothetical protein [Actinophytocola sp. NPDC049390]|uniref:hypothetical protein n=1 Tax=Actinophytocola sp. NPDC049390 TaxID=3363894 RepID=UPI003791AA89